jgi:cyclic beta-1,2-glucan synthetase
VGRLPGLSALIPAATPELCALLDPARGPLQPSIRSEIFGLQRFAQHGRSLGRTHRVARSRPLAPTFHPRLRSNIAVLREAHRYIGWQTGSGHDVSPAAEWLLDNFHLIEAQLVQVREGLPRRYFRELPVLVGAPLAGLPRVYGVAWAFVAHTDGDFDEDLLSTYLRAYQETRELHLSEMWALPTTLRVVLIESLRRLAERVACNKAAREAANLCCDRLDGVDVAALELVHQRLERRGVGGTFLAQMALRLQEPSQGAEGSVRPEHLVWLQHALPDASTQHAQQGADQAADNLSVRNAVNALREIGDADWADIVARTSALMRSMLRSPVFEAEHATTRDETLHGIERLARRSGLGEGVVAQRLLQLMGATPADALSGVPGHWLAGAGRPTLLRVLGLREQSALAWRTSALPLALPAYLAVVLLSTVGLLVWLLESGAPSAVGPGLGVALLMALPASEAVIAVIHRLISESAQPCSLPRLALRAGIPAEHRALVAVPALLGSVASVQALLHRLELHHLANPEREVQFALLSDGVDADAERVDGDAALLSCATQGIEALNARHPGLPGAAPRFVLLHRARRFSPSEQAWIGWERKRGKLEQLVAALAQGGPGPFVDLGELSRLAEATRYVVTLDSDTQLPPGSLRALVGVAAHPLNRPRLDLGRRRVDAGYGILQPRILTPLPARQELTPFHALFAGPCGLDPYSAASSEVYQDLFGEGSFSGKGLLDVQAVHAVLSGRLPEGLVLSHDLFEGSLARCAAVTDIGLVEAAPFHADVAASRVHRWTRGDWQLLPLLLSPWRYRLRAVNRWKLLDNLRRSLVAPASLALVVLSLTGSALVPVAALALVLAAFSAGPVLGALAGLWPRSEDGARGYFFRQAGAGLMRSLGGGLWHLAQLLQLGRQRADAIGRALWRMGISRRRLLQWTTAATAQAESTTRLDQLLRRHAVEPALALLLTLGLLAAGTPHPAMTVALGLLWAASPLWTWWASRPPPARTGAALPGADRVYLEAVARDTWRYFERCVSADDNHLPPDNLQTLPQEMLAHRTSPTNIGLYLLSAACAREFGWIGSAELLQRLEATLDTLDRLQRHRGHFLNWYDTQTCAPLPPHYVSTVDSGNLGGHLLAVGQACLAFAHAGHGEREEGPTGRTDPPESVAVRLRAVAARCTGLAWAADYRFLYHPRRHLFHIGYRVAEQALDAGFYDLLASESRLTSLLAIAKGDVPVGHWAALGRPFYAVGAVAGLRSWSGSMFEYLMPSLLIDEPEGSVLRDAGLAALREQIAYARLHDVPWGISESAYAGRDSTLAYQYAPQGVPRLALRRTPPDELVIAPYATALAAQRAPRRAAANLAALEALGARGSLGFIEALDYTPSRCALGEPYTPVATSMAHHQGMTIVALTNVLRDDVVRRWAMAEPHLEAMVPLLHERAPREVPRLRAAPTGPAQGAELRGRAPGLLRQVRPGEAAVEPTHILSNGRYRVTLRASGAGWSRWGPVGIQRWRDDALRDASGSFFYLRRADEAARVSLSQHPAPDPDACYGSIFHADRVCLEARWPDLQTQVTVWVSPEDDIEFRQVELRNLGDAALDLELISAFELALAEPGADEAHPAFSNLFVRASWRPAMQALVFERRPRLAGERVVMAAHFLAASDPPAQALHVQTDRLRWLGRNRGTSRPLAALDAAPVMPGDVPVPMDTGLDPVCAIALRVRILPGAKALLTFATAATDNGGVLSAVIDKYRQPVHVQRASLMSATLTGIRLRAWGMGANDFVAIQSLSSALVHTLSRPDLVRGAPAACSGFDRRLLWRFGVSGDRPIVLVLAQAAQGQGLLRSLALALRLWAWGGVGCDLVVLNAEPVSYAMAVQQELRVLRERHDAENRARGSDACTGLFVVQAHEITDAEKAALHGLARVRLVADGRPLAMLVQGWMAGHEAAFERRHEGARCALPAAAGPASPAPAPQGRFTAEGADFVFEAGEALRPARPWINVIANADFGTLLSEAGGGHTWAGNSRLNQLTAWSNDAVADPPSEWLLLQDMRTRQVWSATASGGTASDGAAVVYRVTHGQGWSRIEHRKGDAEVILTWCVDPVLAVKQLQVAITNRGTQTLHLRLAGLVEWTMGAGTASRATVHTARLRQRLPEGWLTGLLCTQLEASGGFGNGTACFAVAHGSAQPHDPEADWTCDRREFFDARGRLVLPDHLGRSQGRGLDPCAALALHLDIAPGTSAACVFLLAYAGSPDAARSLVTRAAAMPPDLRLDAARSAWDTLLQATKVTTPDPLFDALVNRWLLYQTVSCRLWAKAGFYQAGGATGFRDQLQDAMALAVAAPHLLRAQILLAASRQFPEGDVQHWWHAPGGAGVRTHFSDDLLWLPKACAHYLVVTGDATLLSETVPFIEGPVVPPGAEDVYATPVVSALTATVYEHAARTIDRSLRVGAHGLPLMGSGDWNDAMNRVGHEGRGESVWLGWFLCTVVAAFAPIARSRGEAQRAERWDAAAQGWQRALRGPAWDGAWFRRAFFDDGSPLGSQGLAECRIDLIAQAWAVLSGVATWPQQVVAMAAVDAQLADAKAGLLRLLDPPLQHARPSAGYIQAYPPGVRENGGQYTHGAVWALMAQARMTADHGHPESGEAAWRYFTWLSPAHRAADPQQGAAYGLEPYVMAGDVYTQPPYVGRGGWSWYTGAAAWMHRAAIESILGLSLDAGTLSLRPCLPAHWPRAELSLLHEGRRLRFVLLRGGDAQARREAAACGATLLRRGEQLAWRDLPQQAGFVVPLDSDGS